MAANIEHKTIINFKHLIIYGSHASLSHALCNALKSGIKHVYQNCKI